MASCLQLLCDKRRKNGGFSNNNYQESGDNAHCLMEEFCCLYSEKLKAIDEEYQDSLEPKCQALTELVSDLTEQNYLLLKAVEELEKEALSRVEAFGSLAEAAKDTIQQDNLRRGIDANESHRLESKVQKLQDALKQNESHMLKCTMEIDQLNKCLLKKHSEVNNSQACLDKMYELESTIGSLESNLKEKCDIIKCLQEENDKLKGNAANGDLRLEEVKFELDQLKEELNQKNCVLNKIQNGVYNPLEETRLDSMKNSNKIFELNNHIKWLEDKLNEQEAILKHTISERDALQFESNQQNTDCDDSNRIETLFQRIECLQEEIEDKNCSIVNLKDQEEKYMYEMSRMKTFMKSMERQFTEKIMCLESEIDKKDALLLKYTKQLENMNSFNVYDEKNAKDNLTRKGANSVIIESKDHSDFNRLKFKLKEIQEALTGEIADKHDEIRRLKDDVKELEEKLLHADKQTQFKDDIIKELRKEVKVGRAKESLAEMLGLKGTPRAAMKTRIDNLTGQLEEMRTHVLSLEERLAECNLPAVISLRSRLNNAEGSLLAMCNKMDYVRRYLENLKGDEELSIKCGLEALLSELSEDVEWNRQTRRNLSLDEGTSVIVISHRSHSLPDNSLHRLVSKAKSDSAVTVNKQGGLHSNYSLESFQECRNYIQVINDLELDFEETRKALCFLWNGFQSYARDNSNSILNDLNDILLSLENSKVAVTDIIRQMEDGDDIKEDSNNMLCYHLQCLKGNIMEISESLSKAQMISSSSENDFLMEAGDSGLKKKLSTAINDSLSIIVNLENLKTNFSQDNSKTFDKNSIQSIESNMSSAISLIKSLLEEKENFFEKLAVVQKQQLEFSQTLFNKIMEFEKGFSTYNSSAESLRRETRKLFAIILTKEKQIQKQFDEIDNLKMALSSNKYVEEASEEIDSLRKVVSNKDLQLVEKQELIQNLKSMNHSLRRKKFSQSSPSLSCTTESSENVMDKFHQLEDGILSIKEKFAAMSSDLLKSKDKIVHFEVATKRLVEVLTRVHQDITSAKESVSQKPEQLSLLHTSFAEAECKVEELLQVLEIFICNDQPDFEEFSEFINNHIDIILEIIEFLKRSYENERVFIKSLKDENEEMKQQLNKLQNRLTVTSSQQTELNENQQIISKECETAELDIYTKDDYIQGLKEDLCRSNAYLEQLEKEYTCLKWEKAELEETNQKVMEELQAKVCKLQEAALQNQAPEASEVKSLKKKMNAIYSMYTELEMEFEDAKEYIIALKRTQSEKEDEFENMKFYIEYQQHEIEKLSEELKVKSDQLNEMQISREELGEKEVYWENLMLNLKKEISEIAEEAMHWHTVSFKQKENLTNLIEENQILKTENDEFESRKEKLIYDLETNRKQLCELTEELTKSKQIIYQLNEEKNALENINLDLQSDLHEKENVIVENNVSRDTLAENLLREQEEFIGFLLLKNAQVNNFLSDRDETINLLESQLKTSTMLMLDNFDFEEDEKKLPVTFKDGNMIKMPADSTTAAYKMKLWQSLEVNRKLIKVIDSLHQLNHKLIQEQAYRKQLKHELLVQHDEANDQYIETSIPS